MAILAQVCAHATHPKFFSMEETAMSGVVGGAEVVEIVDDDDISRAGAIIEQATAAASANMADGGAMVALEKLQELVDSQAANGVESPIEGWLQIEERPATSYAPSYGETQQMEVHPLAGLRDEVMAAGRKRPAPETEVEVDKELDVDEVIEEAVNKIRPCAPRALKMPWEIGFAGLVLGDVNPFFNPGGGFGLLEPRGSVPKIDLEEKVVQNEPEEKTDVLTKLFGGTRRRPMKLEEAERRDKVKNHWLVLIRVMGDSTPIYAMIDADGEEVLDDVFAKKKTGTLEVRASALMLYVRWCQAKGFTPFPVSEALSYVYVDELRKNNAPPTRANSFRSTLAFCKGALLLQNIDEILMSSRVTGSAHRSFLNKRLLKQRDALTVCQVQVLEHVVCGSFPLKDRVFAGHCLLCVYGRLRFGDSQNIEEEPVLEEDFVECGISMHKTVHLAGRSRRLLPVVAPTVGVTGENWGGAFLEARAEATLRAWPGLPFQPAPVLGGDWSLGKLQTTEAAMWLCELLHRHGVPKEHLTNVGAHSLKATALSWLAKAGVDEKPRRLLGYHVKPKDSSVVLYSRDALAGSLAELMRVVEAIRTGKFRPDVSRSGRWVKVAEVFEPQRGENELSDDDEQLDVGSERATSVTTETEGKVVERLAVLADQTSESEEEDVDEEESADERNVEAVVVNMVGAPRKANSELYRHSLTGTVHKGSVEGGKLACGRKITSMTVVMNESVHAVGAMCKVCAGYVRG